MVAAASLIDEAGLLARLLAANPVARQIVGIAGPPGSGKSTVAERPVAAANAARLAMRRCSRRTATTTTTGCSRRWAAALVKARPIPLTLGGLAHTLARLRARDEAVVAVPVFDRSIEIARAGARLIAQSVRLVVVEGNYLLLDAEDWAALRAAFDLTVMIETPEARLRARLTRRWQDLHLAPDEIARKVEQNDLPNGRRVIALSQRPDLRLQT